MKTKSLTLKDHMKAIRAIPSKAREEASRRNGAKAARLSKEQLTARSKKAWITRRKNLRISS
jgi:hypothetical protein